IENGVSEFISRQGNERYNWSFAIQAGDHDWDYVHLDPTTNQRLGVDWQNGQQVRQYDQIGPVTSAPTGGTAHLHLGYGQGADYLLYGVRPTDDPLTYLTPIPSRRELPP